ncbi:MAG: T9SS type A sorting domain-containing protein [Bacteroidota bacterium]
MKNLHLKFFLICMLSSCVQSSIVQAQCPSQALQYFGWSEPDIRYAIDRCFYADTNGTKSAGEITDMALSSNIAAYKLTADPCFHYVNYPECEIFADTGIKAVLYLDELFLHYMDTANFGCDTVIFDDNYCNSTFFAQWISIMNSKVLMSKVVAFALDEPILNYDENTVTADYIKLNNFLAMVKGVIDSNDLNIKIWVNFRWGEVRYKFDNYFLTNILPNIDWIGYDVYDDFTEDRQCYELSLYNKLIDSTSKRIMLYGNATAVAGKTFGLYNCYLTGGTDTSPLYGPGDSSCLNWSTMPANAKEKYKRLPDMFYDLAIKNPKVIGIMAFQWNNNKDGGSSGWNIGAQQIGGDLKANWEKIGTVIKNCNIDSVTDSAYNPTYQATCCNNLEFTDLHIPSGVLNGEYSSSITAIADQGNTIPDSSTVTIKGFQGILLKDFQVSVGADVHCIVVPNKEWCESYSHDNPTYARSYKWSPKTTKSQEKKIIEKIVFNQKVSLNEKDVIQIYPNPSSSKISLSVNPVTDNLITVEIISITGSVMKTIKSPEHNLSIDIGDYATGIYCMKIMRNGKTNTLTFIKD